MARLAFFRLLVFDCNYPSSCILFPDGLFYGRVELDVRYDIILFGDRAEILLYLRSHRVLSTPVRIESKGVGVEV